MDYSSVAPPQSSGSSDNTAFADALARARQIAAKINQPGAEEPSSLKRPFEGSSESQPEPKKLAGMSEQGLVGAQLKAIHDQQQNMADQQRAQQAVQLAANAAAQINAKLGINNQGQPPNPPQMGGPPQMGHMDMGGGNGGGMGLGGGMGGMVHTENYSVPDRMVGLVIGKGGENLSGIQAESGVKIQFAPDSGGAPERPCTLTGSPEGILKAKELIARYISSKAKELHGREKPGQGMGDGMGLGDNVVMEEVMIPGNKVGLVIGKGGENIKHLQESANVKMVMIQDSNTPSHVDKPLRITGEPSRVQAAKGMVFDLLAEKEAQAAQYGGGGGGGGGRGTEIPVPRNLVGVIIGRGGEMIKKIQSETGARVQFKPDDGQGPDRQCSVTGNPDSINQAAEMIHNLLNSAMQNDRGGNGGGRRERGDMDGGGGGGGGRRRFDNGGGDETTFIVPADKTGLVIGRGGETIKEIARTSGAQVELARDQQSNPHERVFRINGNPDEIQTAIQMIAEKAGIPPEQNGRGGGGPGGPGGNGFGGPGGYGGPPGGGGFGGQSPPPGPGGPQQGGGPPQGWGNAYQQWSNPPQQQEQSKPADQNSAAWAAYYQQYYQGGPNQGQQAPQQPPQQQPVQPQSQPQQQAAVNPQTGQPDYSAAWADYYRQQGMHYHAQAILQQAAQQNPGAPGGAPGGAAPGGQGAPGGWQGAPGTGGQ